MEITDTTSKAREVQRDLYRQMSPARKIELVFDAYRIGQILSMAGIRMQHPDAGDRQLWCLWAQRHLGEELYKKVYGNRRDG